MEVHHTVPNCEVRAINRYKLIEGVLTVFR